MDYLFISLGRTGRLWRCPFQGSGCYLTFLHPSDFCIEHGQQLIYVCRMILMVRLAPADAALLSKIGSATLLESHGHSAPADILHDYVSKAFNEEACLCELSDAHNLFHGIFYNGV
ncbi:MAG TPA: hypothetical protein VER36_11700, partial [Flavisolibacter sp.]|nr:hypothetical protein [Flavisolibacter sp.]